LKTSSKFEGLETGLETGLTFYEILML